MSKIQELDKIGDFTVLYSTPYIPEIKSTVLTLQCVCGQVLNLKKSTLVRRKHKDCGCKRKYNQKFYEQHRAMISRCHNENSKHYKNYGAIGVIVCDRWRFGENGLNGLECFTEDMLDSWYEGASLNRIQGALLYSKETCQWENCSVQNYERRRLPKNKTGRTGVTLCKRKLLSGEIVYSYRATIKPNAQSKQIDLGCYKSFEDAVMAREEAEIKYFGKIKGELLEDYYCNP